MRISEALGFQLLFYGSIAAIVIAVIGLGYWVYRMWQ